MADPRWNCYPAVAQLLTARTWLQMQADLDRSPNTVAAYGRDLEDYLTACRRFGVNPETATRGDIARYVRDLKQRSSPQRAEPGLSNATMQ